MIDDDRELLRKILRRSSYIHTLGGEHWLLVSKDVLSLTPAEYEHINTLMEEEA